MGSDKPKVPGWRVYRNSERKGRAARGIKEGSDWKLTPCAANGYGDHQRYRQRFKASKNTSYHPSKNSHLLLQTSELWVDLWGSLASPKTSTVESPNTYPKRAWRAAGTRGDAQNIHQPLHRWCGRRLEADIRWRHERWWSPLFKSISNSKGHYIFPDNSLARKLSSCSLWNIPKDWVSKSRSDGHYNRADTVDILPIKRCSLPRRPRLHTEGSSWHFVQQQQRIRLQCFQISSSEAV